MRALQHLPGKACFSVGRASLPAIFAGLFLLVTASVSADQPLMTLSVESAHLAWQDDFVLTLTIYASAESGLPDVTIDGLDQFELKGTGKNLLQVPRGKTEKWILTYSLTATHDGTFKV